MNTFLSQILAKKRKEVALLKHKGSLPPPQKPLLGFIEALRGDELKVIAEIKRRSPSKGPLNEELNVEKRATEYVRGGANAISVLTDAYGFSGSLNDLKQVRALFPKLPLLRKDFIIDPLQIHESAAYGASGVLLIVAVLKEQTSFFIQECKKYHLDPLVEVHTLEELQVAMDAKAQLIGVNNRDLNTFQVSLKRSEELIAAIPKEIVTVAESGLNTPKDCQIMEALGFDAVLVGEALVKAHEPASFIQQAKERKKCL